MSVCACDSSVPEFYDQRERTARKPHQCGECKIEIPIGTRYAYLVGKNLGENFWDFMMCLRCDELWSKLFAVYAEANKELCRCLGQLFEQLSEALDDEAVRCGLPITWLIEQGYIEPDESCPGAYAVLSAVASDPRQMKFTLA